MGVPSTRLRLRVVPGAKRAAVAGRLGDGWKLRVTAPPERGAANDAVLRLLADVLAVPYTAVSLVSGHARRDKIVEVAGIAPAEIEHRLSAAD